MWNVSEKEHGSNRVTGTIAITTALLALTYVFSALLVQADARPRPEATPQGNPVGGRVLGLSAICDDCRAEKFTSECTGFLEAPVFDREGTLWVAGILKGVIWRITPDGHCAVGMQLPAEVKYPCGLRFSHDGTLYGVAMGYGLFSVDMSSKKVTLLTGGASLGGLPDGAFHGLDDIFIDRTGGMYLTDAAGSSVLNPVGQLFYREASGNIKRIISGGLELCVCDTEWRSWSGQHDGGFCRQHLRCPFRLRRGSHIRPERRLLWSDPSARRCGQQSDQPRIPQWLPLRHGERKRRDLAGEGQNSRHQPLWWFVARTLAATQLRLRFSKPFPNQDPVSPACRRNRSSIRHQLQ